MILCIFSNNYKSEIEMDLLAVRQALSKQSDIDLPKTHFPSSYLADPKKLKITVVEKCIQTQRCSTYNSQLFTPIWTISEAGRVHWW